MIYAIIGIFLLLIVYALVKARLMSQFTINAILGLLFCVAAVCLAPTLNMRFSLNFFTAAVSALLGPAGVAGLLVLMWLWEM